MIIGALQFELLIHDAASLKDKRSVVKSVKDRLHREHLVAVAEVAALDTLNVAVMGLALVGNDGKVIGQALDRITEKLRTLREAELGIVHRELIRGSDAEDAPADDVATETDPVLAAELLERAAAAVDEQGPGR
jgi:hypothetical protein